jgi:hypothetical protein
MWSLSLSETHCMLITYRLKASLESTILQAILAVGNSQQVLHTHTHTLSVFVSLSSSVYFVVEFILTTDEKCYGD